jgi:hypothetical protein
MEGFLTKKTRGEKSLLARTSWAKRWFVVEGHYMHYFETFDPRRDSVVNEKGMIPLKDTVVLPVTVQDRKFCFVIKHPQRADLVLEADSEALRKGRLTAWCIK